MFRTVFFTTALILSAHTSSAADVCSVTTSSGSWEKLTATDYVKTSSDQTSFRRWKSTRCMSTFMILPSSARRGFDDVLDALQLLFVKQIETADLGYIVDPADAKVPLGLLYDAAEMALFDRPEPMKALVKRVVDEAKAGSPDATDALLKLGEDKSPFTVNGAIHWVASIIINEGNPIAQRYDLERWIKDRVTINDPEMTALHKSVVHAADDMRSGARQSGSATAHVQALSGRDYNFDPCDTTLNSGVYPAFRKQRDQ
ncbi:MAG: hypothetical protein R3D84_03085 [Paracoccaceae bacterium]